MRRGSALEFGLEAASPSGVQSLRAFVRSPEIVGDHPGCWTCFVGWDGPSGLERPVFGATPLQAVALALPVLEALLRSRYPAAVLTTDGRPFVLDQPEPEQSPDA